MGKNRVCEILQCNIPIIEGGMAYVGNGRLAAAVSEAGGFGQIGSGGRSIPSLEREIQIAAYLTTKPIGINIPISVHKDPLPYIEIAEKYYDRLHAVSLSAGNPAPYIRRLKKKGLVVLTVVSTPSQALKAEREGADLVVCEGVEAGGHNGKAEIATLTLVPTVKDTVRVPVIAAGGIADGRAIAAAFCLGAEGVQMGTRFVATIECEAHHAYKQAVVRAEVTDTIVLERSLGKVTRVLNTAFTRSILAQEADTPSDGENLGRLISGNLNSIAAVGGHLESGILDCGQSAGLIHNLISAGEVVISAFQESKNVIEKTFSQFQRNLLP